MLFRDAAAIENLRKIDTLIIDKTGTLTEGRPVFDRVVAASGFDESEVLRLAASLDQGSEHPLAEAIVNAAHERGLPLETPDNFESGSGIGVRGQVGDRPVSFGQHSTDGAIRYLGTISDSASRRAAFRRCKCDASSHQW